ncbi:MAG TPA: S8 family serine peptidase, partial [Blastocatellia bacterium]|nr:S8 family serine peptidase [Blastocatellia bacterium]
WLAARGFASNFDFAIDITDSGIDRGSIDPTKLHPDFLDSAKQSRLLYAREYTSEFDPSDVGGHGTLNMSVAGGNGEAQHDAAGYGYGIGVAPFAMLGSSKIFTSTGLFDLAQPYTGLVAAGYESGARIFSNSWGAGNNQYTIDSEEYDLRVRDADPSQPGNQETVICFAAGNGGPGTIGNPGTAKNVLSVGATESPRAGGDDGCGVTDDQSNNAESMAFFSSSGPVNDGRIKPDIVAPGTHIQGAASQNPNFDGSGVCGGANSPYFPAGQTLYTWSSGTSHSTPQVAGAAALARQFFINNGISDPSAALIKALLLNTTSYVTGAGGNLPQASQGWGLLDLDRAFDDTPKVFVNQTDRFTESGQDFVMTGEVKDPTRPFRVTLAWTDAPGFSLFAPWINNLDLEVTVNGQVYLGNNFQGQSSQPGGTPDPINNVEAVWLPAGTVGSFEVRVRATSIGGDGVPGNADTLDQDFGLVVYNAEQKAAPVLALTGLTLSSQTGTVAEPGATVSMTLNVQDVAPTGLIDGPASLTSDTSGVTVTTGSSSFAAIDGGQSGQNETPFVFTVDPSVACGSEIQFRLDISDQVSTISFPFTIEVGNVSPGQFFTDDIESGGAKWTHGPFKVKKRNLDTWSISSRLSHSGNSSWFSLDPPRVADAHLDTLPIQLPANGQHDQLVFFHTFAFEPGSFDGGVIEISTGGSFQDLGPDIISGGYNGLIGGGNIFVQSQNHLAGQPAWVNGRLGAFQKVVVDLSSFAGKTVVIRFRFCSDESGSAPGWFIDDVSVNGNLVSCSPGA